MSDSKLVFERFFVSKFFRVQTQGFSENSYFVVSIQSLFLLVSFVGPFFLKFKINTPLHKNAHLTNLDFSLEDLGRLRGH